MSIWILLNRLFPPRATWAAPRSWRLRLRIAAKAWNALESKQQHCTEALADAIAANREPKQ